MQHGIEPPSPHFFGQGRDHVLVRVAGVDHERQAGLASSRDVAAEAPLLTLARTIIPEIIEPGLADCDDLGTARELYEIGSRDIRFFIRVMRVRADRAKDVVVSRGNLFDVGEFLDPRADRNHASDAFGARARDDRIALGGKIRKVEMTMAVDEHRYAVPSSGSM